MSLRGDAVVAWPLFQESIGGSIPTSPLQLRIREISVRRAMDLNYQWHSVLPETHHGNLVGHSRCVFYGAEYEGKFYAVAIWTDPIAANRLTDGETMLELRRLAICEQAPKNTASRMLRVMRILLKKRYPELTKLISYQAEDFHRGTIYKAAGWNPVNRSEFVTWAKPEAGRSHKYSQIESAKIRWECEL